MPFNINGRVPITNRGACRLASLIVLLLTFVLPSPCGQGNCSPKPSPNPIQRLAGVDSRTLREATALIKEGESHLALTRLGYQPGREPTRVAALRRWAAWVILEVADTLGVLPG